MSEPIPALYGTWESPITPDAIAEGGAKISELVVDPITSTIYHVEGRPAENGRSVLVKTERGQDVVEKSWNVRTGVQEYGGGAATVYDGVVYFSNYTDNRLYMTKEGSKPVAITPDNNNHRFANIAVHPIHNHLLVAILEDHTNPLPPDVVTTLSLINSQTQAVSTLVSGTDFYSFPTFSPDGTKLAWQQWTHPDMPWEGAEIYVANVSADDKSLSLSDVTYVAGKKNEISACYPAWASKDVLLFTSDVSGYQNPWIFKLSIGKATAVLPSPVDEDFGLPAWSLGIKYGTPLDDTASWALFTAIKDDRSKLYLVNLQSGVLEPIESPYSEISAIVRITRDVVVFIAERSDGPESVVTCSLTDYAKPLFTTITASAASRFPSSYISIPQSITLKIPPNDEVLHVLYLSPHNPKYVGYKDEKPPCVVHAHGGPTGRDSASLDWSKQYFTSRGWAWLDVNYGGSSGYGRKYIERLAGKWGIIDVQDCVRAVDLLSAEPYSLIDRKRCVIRGGSAGGYTTLASICFEPDAFAVATSLYGIADLRGLAKDTHKFELRYMEKLMGGTIDEIPEVYEQRSPVFHADKIKTPLLVLQGALDAVVPPSQAEVIVNAIKKRGGQVEYTVFEGEGHGWRKAKTIEVALEKELHFYEKVLNLKNSGIGGQ